jgi:hypothetical protein
MTKRNIPYPNLGEEDSGSLKVAEPAMVMAVQAEQAIPDNVAYARIENGILQVTTDIEEEIAAADRGETVSMPEFKTMFAQWL